MLRLVTDLAPRLFAVAALVLLGTSGAQAQKVRPGLWEYKITMKSGGGQADAAAAAMSRMREEMASMTPEQRAQVEAMMGRQGMGMAPGGGHGITARSCVTPEMAARSEIDFGQQGRCTNTHSRSGNTLRFKFSCQGEDASTTEGEGEATLVSETEIRGRTRTVTTRKGQASPMMDVESRGKWLAADCGDVKPRQQRK